MAIPRSDDDNVTSENNLTPLIAAMLVLLILLFVAAPLFFVSAPLLSNAVPVTLPKATTDLLIPPQVAPDRISVIGDGAHYLEDPVYLETELKDHINLVNQNEASAGIMADEQIEYEILSKVMNSWLLAKPTSSNQSERASP